MPLARSLPGLIGDQNGATDIVKTADVGDDLVNVGRTAAAVECVQNSRVGRQKRADRNSIAIKIEAYAAGRSAEIKTDDGRVGTDGAEAGILHAADCQGIIGGDLKGGAQVQHDA